MTTAKCKQNGLNHSLPQLTNGKCYSVLLSYGCTREVAKHERSLRVARDAKLTNQSVRFTLVVL